MNDAYSLKKGEIILILLLFQKEDANMNNQIEHKIEVNDITMTLKFSNEPCNDTGEQILSVLIDSYERRIMQQIT